MAPQKPCTISCAIAAIFIIANIYMMYASTQNNIIAKYEKQLKPEQKAIYRKIVKERTTNYYTGFAIGLALAAVIIMYNRYVVTTPFSTMPLVCIVVSVSFLTNYFYYILAPKKNWMLDHLSNPEDIKAWSEMYKGMQKYYHGGLVLGLIAVGFIGFAFRC